MGAPLIIKGVVNGVAIIQVYRQGTRYTKSDLDTFTLISYQLALMIDQIQANLDLRVSEEKYRRLFDDAVLGVFQSSKDGELITGNMAFVRMLGYSTQKETLSHVKNIGADLFLNEEKWEMIKDHSIEAKQTSPIEVSLKTMDGKIVFGNLYAWSVKDDYGEVQFIEGFIEDITSQKRTEAELKETSHFALEVINNANTGVVVIDLQSRILVFNPYIERVSGVLSSDFIGKRLVDLYPEYYDQGWDDQLKKVMVDGETVRLEDLNYHLSITGKKGWVNGSVSPHRDALGAIIGAIFILTDVTERVETYEQLRTSEHLYRSTVDTLEDWLHVVNTNLQVELMNAALRDKCIELGLPFEQHHIKDIFPFLDEKVFDEYKYVIEHNEVIKTIETSELAGRKYITETTKEPVIEDSKVVRIITTMRDITQQKEAEQQLLAALREKEVLVREVHHRVKNNLQVMTSLLSLQADTVQDPVVRDMFRETQSRVRSMSLIHVVLYQSEDLSQIDLQVYFEKLTGHLTYLFGTNPEVKLLLEVDPMQMKIDTAKIGRAHV
jgi:PAS domain S-box-containing protein